jgi:hypothetical protein
MEIHREIPLNINLEINNERQDCKIGFVCVCVCVCVCVYAGGRVNKGDQGEGIWLEVI